jgi:hypothetical protein
LRETERETEREKERERERDRERKRETERERDRERKRESEQDHLPDNRLGDLVGHHATSDEDLVIVFILWIVLKRLRLCTIGVEDESGVRPFGTHEVMRPDLVQHVLIRGHALLVEVMESSDDGVHSLGKRMQFKLGKRFPLNIQIFSIPGQG